MDPPPSSTIPPDDRGQRRLRIGRASVQGQTYFITANTVDRKAVFADAEAAAIVLDCARWLDAHARWFFRVAVVMPNHVHLIVELRDFSLPSVMKSFKGYAGWSINRLLGTHGQIWQDGYYDHAIRNDESFFRMVRYCLENPVDANLADVWTDYPFTFVDVEGFRPGDFENELPGF